MPIPPKLTTLCLPPVVVVAVHGFFVFGFDAYTNLPWLDILMHFVGGLVIGFTLNGCLAHAEPGSLIRVNSASVRFGLNVCLVTTAATVWEFAEFLCDRVFGTRSQDDLEDTMLDLFAGIVGGMLFASIVFLRNRHKKNSSVSD